MPDIEIAFMDRNKSDHRWNCAIHDLPTQIVEAISQSKVPGRIILYLTPSHDDLRVQVETALEARAEEEYFEKKYQLQEKI